MEGVALRAYGFAALMLAGGAFARFGTPTAQAPKTEAWLENQSLRSLGRYKMEPPTTSDPNVTYKIDAATYKELAPYGIVARVFSDGLRRFDVLLVASQEKGSFHDPRVCFSAQGWQLNDESTIRVRTKLRGPVPISIADMNSDEGDRWGAYFYRGPYGFAASTNDLKLQMFRYSLLNARNADGVFYRFIAEDPGSTKDDLVQFISDYLDSSARYGTGYF